MKEHTEDVKTAADDLPIVHPDYDPNIAQIAGLCLLFVGIITVALLAAH